MDPITLFLLAASIGGGVWYYKTHQQATTNAKASIPPLPPAGLTYDPGMSSQDQAIINSAMLNENDPTNLRTLASMMRAKGYNNSAAALEAKAAATQLTGGKPVIPPPTPQQVIVSPPLPPVGLPTINIPQGVVSTPSGPTAASQLVDPTSPMALSDVQHALNVLGYTGADGQPLTEDGLFGPNTTYAISDFEGQHQLTQDGTAGPEVWATLRAMIAAKNLGVL